MPTAMPRKKKLKLNSKIYLQHYYTIKYLFYTKSVVMTKEQFLNDQYVSGFIQWLRDKLSNFTHSYYNQKEEGGMAMYLFL